MTRRTARSTIHAIAVAVAVACTVAVGGCGVPTDSEVHTIDSGDIPSNVTSASQQEGQPTSTSGRPRVFLADAEGALVPTSVQTEHTSSAEVLKEVLDQLTMGPTTAQTEQGLSSFIPPSLTMTVDEIADGKASIALGGDQLPNTNQTAATAQIVLSATSVSGVSRIQLTLNDRIVEAPLPDGALTAQPLTAENYRSLLSPPPN
jgi:spore germination protein GerM